MPSEEIREAEGKIERLAAVKIEIDASLAKAQKHLEEARMKIRSNLLTEENPYGVLTRGEEKYLKSLELDYRSLENLMRQDEGHWTDNLEVVKRDSIKIKDQIEAMVKRQA